MTRVATIAQIPVGQGGLHTGLLRAGRDFRYVFDCGSTSSSLVVRRMRDAIPREAVIDFLFLSHLDNDHVNGLCALTSTRSVHTVVLPYFDMDCVLLQLAAQVQADDYSVNYVDFLADPAHWLRARGVSDVVMIAPDSDDGEAVPAPPVEPPPDLKDKRDWKIENPAPDLAKIKGVRIIGRGSCFGFELGEMGTASCTWILRPYAHPLGAANERDLVKPVLRSLGIAPGRWTRGGLAAALAKPGAIASLREVYKTHVGRSRNFISMSLYSGPIPGQGNQLKTRFGRPWHWRHHPHSYSASGWLLTGDAELRSKSIRTKWSKFYSTHANEIGRIMLPHHGADANFDDEILSIANYALPFATASGSGKHHPGAGVIGAVTSMFNLEPSDFVVGKKPTDLVADRHDL